MYEVNDMRKKNELLTKGEESLMELFWDASEPLTSMQLSERTDAFNDSYIHKLLKSLLAKNIIKVEGLVASGKQYARAFQPMMTREEYAAEVMCELGIRGEKAIAKVVVAMVKASEESSKDVLVKQLESMVQELKGK